MTTKCNVWAEPGLEKIKVWVKSEYTTYNHIVSMLNVLIFIIDIQLSKECPC